MVSSSNLQRLIFNAVIRDFDPLRCQPEPPLPPRRDACIHLAFRHDPLDVPLLFEVRQVLLELIPFELRKDGQKRAKDLIALECRRVEHLQHHKHLSSYPLDLPRTAATTHTSSQSHRPSD